MKNRFTSRSDCKPYEDSEMLVVIALIIGAFAFIPIVAIVCYYF